jgi:DNA polymerase-3 subunit beta
MKALCNREGLLAALTMVSGVVPARSPKPILQSVKLVADDDDGSILMATDLEVGIRYRVLGVKVDQPGAIILPTQRMQSILRTSVDDELAIELKGDLIDVRGLHAEFELPTEDPDLFPEVPDFGQTPYHVVAAPVLKRLIRRTIFATDVESTRYALGGVLFEFTPSTITLVGTDGRRLAHASAAAEAEAEPATPSGSPVIPVKALKLLERNLDDSDPPVHIALQSGTSALVRTDRAVIYSRLLEGRFPRYQDVFPPPAEARIPFPEIEPLLQAVEQAAIVTSDESRGVDFTFGNGLLTLRSRAADVGRSEVELPINYEGATVEITFDPRYLIDALKALDPRQPATIELIDSKYPAMLRTEDDYRYVIMPLTRDR